MNNKKKKKKKTCLGNTTKAPINRSFLFSFLSSDRSTRRSPKPIVFISVLFSTIGYTDLFFKNNCFLLLDDQIQLIDLFFFFPLFLPSLPLPLF